MLEMLAPGTSLTWDLLWQSCLFLSLGLGASLALRLRPARAHRVLVLAMLGALLTPFLSQAIRRVGWGVLKQPEPAASVAETAPQRHGHRHRRPARSLSFACRSPRAVLATWTMLVRRRDSPRAVRSEPSSRRHWPTPFPGEGWPWFCGQA